MIKSFKDKSAQALFEMRSPGKGFPSSLMKPARRKLVMLSRAASLRDLRSPPSNHLEALTGDRAGQYAIRVNAQWRVCFAWRDGHAYDVEIVDYH